MSAKEKSGELDMRINLLKIVLIILIAAWPISDLLAEENGTDVTTLLVAQNIEMNLANIKGSVKALGDAYVRTYEHTRVMQGQNKWQLVSNKQTVMFRPSAGGSEPKYQAPQPSYLYYHGKELTPNVWRELEVFTKMASMFRLSFDTFNDSWVYLTTKDGAFLVYPYLPLNEAVNNYPPTEQIFYTSADFTNRTFGWTPPYLDLAGAGMMVTVSYPIYQKDELLGVISRDITLTQLAKKVLGPVIASNGRFICLVIDKNGMAIANSQAAGMKEINTVNNAAKTAALYYLAEKSLDKATNDKARTSSFDLYNQAGQLTLEAAKSDPQQTIWHFQFADDNRKVKASAAKIKTTGWFVIILHSID